MTAAVAHHPTPKSAHATPADGSPLNRSTLNRSPFNGFSAGNAALRAGDFAGAVAAYGTALATAPELAHVLAPNLLRARDHHRAARRHSTPLRVGVCAWELAHNCAGRAYTLAQLYNGFASAELIGPLYTAYRPEIWEPIRHTPLPKHSFIVDDLGRFLDPAIAFVAQHPYDLVHLSKPRAPNLFMGVLYKLIWGATVLMDIDDEELAFVGATQAHSLQDHLHAHGALPPLADLAGRAWTQLSVGLATAFDGVTVVNPALKARYGGEIVHHARDEAHFQPSALRSTHSRQRYGIPEDKKVILFFGTPRAHKGLLHTAHAIAQLQRSDVQFLIVGDFPDPALKQKLTDIPGVDYRFMGNQAFSAIPDIVALADLCVLYQHSETLAGQYQTPAKLSDALAMGVPVIATPTPALADVIAAGALYTSPDEHLSHAIATLLDQPAIHAQYSHAGRAYYQRHLSFNNNQTNLENSTKNTLNDHTNQPLAGNRLSAALQHLVGAQKDRRIEAFLK
jgi:glycosyltransferase involved in cell wall biosynthesis